MLRKERYMLRVLLKDQFKCFPLFKPFSPIALSCHLLLDRFKLQRLDLFFIVHSCSFLNPSGFLNLQNNSENSPNFKTGKGWKRTIQKEPKMHNKHLEEKV